VFPTFIEVEPAPTGVQDADLPKDVAVNGGTITVLRFGQGYMLFDTHGVPIGMPIRGRILGYTEQPRRSVPPAVSATKPTNPPAPAPALPLPMSQECAPGANCAMSTGQQGGITAGTINLLPPEPKITWSLNSHNVQNGVTVTSILLSVDHSMEAPAFMATCDLPCKTVNVELMTGGLSTNLLSWSDNPNLAGFELLQPRPLGAGVYVLWSIESLDANLFRVLDVQKAKAGELTLRQPL
jgi:hypothetical protein